MIIQKLSHHEGHEVNEVNEEKYGQSANCSGGLPQ